METKKIYTSPLGDIKLRFEEGDLIALDFIAPDDQDDLPEEKSKFVYSDSFIWLDRYFAGKVPDFIPNHKLNGTEFQKTVWNILKTIPYGKTVSYTDVAEEVARYFGKDNAAPRAVGQAIGANPIPIIIPCHRVIGKNGSLVGYKHGVDKKIALLFIEKTDMSGMRF